MFYQCYHDRSWQIMMISLTTNILLVLNENGIISLPKPSSEHKFSSLSSKSSWTKISFVYKVYICNSTPLDGETINVWPAANSAAGLSLDVVVVVVGEFEPRKKRLDGKMSAKKTVQVYKNKQVQFYRHF